MGSRRRRDERYRQEYGIKDPNKAFGREAKRGAERARQQAATRRLQETSESWAWGRRRERASSAED